MSNESSRGMMTASFVSQTVSATADLYFKVFQGSYSSRGLLKITNTTTGATRSTVMATASIGDLVWDQSADDPTAAAGNYLKIEYFGTAGESGVAITDDLSINAQAVFSGNGTGEVDGIELV